MNRGLGVWTSEECALVLIDYQKEQLESICSETPADLVELHTRWLAKTAKAFDVPIVLSTVGSNTASTARRSPRFSLRCPMSSQSTERRCACREGRKYARRRRTWVGRT